jgi:hypothetical protein
MKKNIFLALVLMMVMSLSACATKATAPAENPKSENTTSEDIKSEDTSSKDSNTEDSNSEDNKSGDSNSEDADSEDNNSVDAENNSSDLKQGEWSTVDKSVTVEGVEYTIKGYKKSKGSELLYAEDGNSYLLIDMIVKNNTEEEAALSSVLMFELADADDEKYDISLGGLSCLEDENIIQADGSVAASSELECGLAFEVPDDAKGLKLSILGLLDDEKQTVDLY